MVLGRRKGRDRERVSVIPRSFQSLVWLVQFQPDHFPGVICFVCNQLLFIICVLGTVKLKHAECCDYLVQCRCMAVIVHLLSLSDNPLISLLSP